MPCNCKKKAATPGPTFEVVASSGSVVYKTSSEGAAKAVSARYRGSTIRTKTGTKS